MREMLNLGAYVDVVQSSLVQAQVSHIFRRDAENIQRWGKDYCTAALQFNYIFLPWSYPI